MGKKGIRDLTVSYSLVQASFWMSLCVFMSFAAVYLQSLGYNNSGLGAIIACGTLLGSLLGPALSSAIDRNGNGTGAGHMTAASLYPVIVALEAAAAVILLIHPVRGPLTSAAFVSFIAFTTSVNSLNLKLYTDTVHRGLSINYGISRSMGSLGYVITSAVIGALCESISPRVIPVAGIILCAMQLLSKRAFMRQIRRTVTTINTPGAGTGTGAAANSDDATSSGTATGAAAAATVEGASSASAKDAGTETGPLASSLSAFLIQNKRFCLLLAGTVLVFFAHNTFCNFMINVTRNAGGDTGDMGLINALMALFETPVVFFFSRLTAKRRGSSVLRFAFVMFTVKAAAIAAAPTVTVLCAAQLLQALSYALYTGAIVPYVDSVVPYKDSAKAQSLAFTMTMLASVFASIISGRLFDIMPAGTVMWAAAAVSAAGTIVAAAGIRDNSSIRN